MKNYLLFYDDLPNGKTTVVCGKCEQTFVMEDATIVEPTLPKEETISTAWQCPHCKDTCHYSPRNSW